MSLLDAKNYFRTQLAELGYREWTDGFNVDNIPSTLFDKAFHIELVSASGGPHENMCLQLEPGFLVRVFLKGFRNPAGKLDEAMDRSQAIIELCLSAAKRLAEPEVWNVLFTSLDMRPLETNDNAIIIELGFSCRVYIETT